MTNQGFQSSFIPKGVAGEEGAKNKTTSIAEVLAISVFILTILSSAGLFVYKGMLKSGIENLRIRLSEAGQAIDKDKIKEMSAFSKKMNLISSIVDKHQVISGFISSLASSTVKTVYFNEFSYSFLQGDLNVSMQGSGDSYGTVALQESLFRKNKYWKDVSFSNLSLEEKGRVGFKVSVSVDPEIVTYAPYIPEPAQETALENISDPEMMKDLGGLDGLDEIEASLKGI